MSIQRESDGDAMAAAMAEVQARQAAAAEAQAQRRVVITGGLVAELIAALRAASEFADRFTGPKKPHGERAPAREIVARNASLVTQLLLITPRKAKPAPKREGRHV